MMQHVNAIVMFGFCILYSLFYLYDCYNGIGIIIWASVLPILYFPNLITIPKMNVEEKRISKKTSIIAGWFFVFFWWGLLFGNSYIKIMSAALLIILIVYCILQIRKLRKGHLQKADGEETYR
jgi:hypothetical protein